MKLAIYLTFILVLHAQSALAIGQLNDVPYAFDPVRVAQAKNSFKFYRAFVDYFYLLLKQNKPESSLLTEVESYQAWCVGDAHIENFAFLVQKSGGTQFTVNDIDDAGPCPAFFDFFRLAVGSQIYSHQIDLHKLFLNYQLGIQNQNLSLPTVLQNAQKKSLSLGEGLSKKILNDQLPRDKESRELSQSERNSLMGTLIQYPPFKTSSLVLLDALATQKIGGGSSGLQRFEVLLKLNNRIFHIELKQQVKPAIYPVATSSIPEQDQRIHKSLEVEQGTSVHEFYGHILFDSLDFYVRPKFIGNIGVNAGNNPSADELEVIYYEAFVLGKIHSRSMPVDTAYIQQLKKISSSELTQLSKIFGDFYKNKFSSLKP